MQTFEELFYQLFYNSLIVSVYCIVRKSSIKIDFECYSSKQVIHQNKLLITINHYHPLTSAQYKICNNLNWDLIYYIQHVQCYVLLKVFQWLSDTMVQVYLIVYYDYIHALYFP